MIGGVHHIGISSPDIDRLIGFYRDLMGFELCYEMRIDQPSPQVDAMIEMDGVTLRMAMMKTGTTYIELFQFGTPAGAPRGPDWKLADHGLNHLCLMVDDVDAEYARLSAAGMHFHTPPVRTAGRPTVACYGRDPDGNRVELIEISDTSVPFHYAHHRLERLKELQG